MNRTISNEIRTQLTRNFFKTGYRHLMNAPETRDLLSTADNTGGALIGQLYSDLWAGAKLQYGRIASLVSTSSNTKGAPFKVPVFDDTASTMSVLVEGGTVPATQDPSSMFSLITGGTDVLVTSLAYSKQFEQDSSDIGAFIQRTVFSRPARAIEYAILNGKDSGTNTTLTNTDSLLASAPVGVASVAITGPTYAQLTALAASTDVMYQNAPGAGFYVNPTTFAYLVAQVSTTGKSLYEFGPDDLLRVGKWPVYVSAANAMPSYNTTTAGAVIALFGSYADAFRLIDIDGGPQVRVVTEAPGLVEQLLNKAIVYVRIAGESTIANAVKSMTSAG